jgi:dipeptidyl aminopeptidase/acylaminoacyl peptidase
VPAAGGQAEIVAGGDRYVTGADCGPDGIVITTSEFDRPAALSLIGRDGEQPLWDPSPGRFLRGRELDVGRPDGTSVHGFVVVPPDLAAGERAPVLLDIHGGPFSQYGLGFFDEFQIYAAAGYVVVACNPRGSDGYGLGWGEAIRGDWGNEDAADIEAFLDAALAETPEADAERIVVTGGSYGGYMTSWLVSHSDRYAAACSERAVNDLLALWAQSDIGHTFCEEVMATDVTSDPHLDPPLLRERSPLSHAASITTPLLILHAEGDQRCPVYQAEAMHTALVRLGRDVEFVLFPGESHELSRNGSPLHRAQRFEVILDFFARRLGR